jgi:hypothetical protein
VAQVDADPGQKAEWMMNSNRETVMLAGRLSGMGNQAECTVSAVKVSLPRLNTWEYVKCDIHLAPESLPDGQYLFSCDFESGAGGDGSSGGQTQSWYRRQCFFSHERCGANDAATARSESSY